MGEPRLIKSPCWIYAMNLLTPQYHIVIVHRGLEGKGEDSLERMSAGESKYIAVFQFPHTLVQLADPLIELVNVLTRLESLFLHPVHTSRREVES